MIRDHDALIVGAGGAGLWAALELAKAGVDLNVGRHAACQAALSPRPIGRRCG